MRFWNISMALPHTFRPDLPSESAEMALSGIILSTLKSEVQVGGGSYPLYGAGAISSVEGSLLYIMQILLYRKININTDYRLDRAW